MHNSLVMIILILTLSGLVGGLTNFFISEEADKKIFNLLRSIFLGLCASFMVPLFLNMISSNLLEQILGSESKPGDPLKILVLVGFCLVAAIYSRKFIQNIYDRLMKEIKDAEKKVEKKVDYDIEPILAKETENEQPDEIKALYDTNFAELSEDQRKVLTKIAEGKFVLRSIRGIAKDTGLPPESVKQAINGLISKGLIGQREREGGPRWFITREGRKNVPNT